MKLLHEPFHLFWHGEDKQIDPIKSEAHTTSIEEPYHLLKKAIQEEAKKVLNL